MRLSTCFRLVLACSSCADAFQLSRHEARVSTIIPSTLPFQSYTKTQVTSSGNAQIRSIHRLRLQPQTDEEAEKIEEARLGIWKSRRSQVRSMLRGAESLRNFRLARGLVPHVDPETGKPVGDDNGKTAITVTAFAVAVGAIVLRIGGRAALVNAVGLEFLTDNPELQSQVARVLEASESMDPIVRGGLFCLAWTAIKVLCFDAGGVVLALSSGILFGGVLQGTLMSAFGATVGSSVAFALAKADTPVRKKALEVVRDNPSLRGIEKVVADDGLKAVLTLRLAPILPIPLGMYNYVYGISNVRYLDFAGGIFLGSLKPYLLDSYLGYFGKTLVDGTANQDGGLQDYILVGVLGVSVLIGVFASQLATETWEAVLEEQKKESKLNKCDNSDDDVTTEIFGWKLPQWMVGFQYALRDADERMNTLVLQEYEAKVWNYTEAISLWGVQRSKNDIPEDKNPAKVDPASPELAGRCQGIDFGASTCDGIVLSPILFTCFLMFSDPLFDEEEFARERQEKQAGLAGVAKLGEADVVPSVSPISFGPTPLTASLPSGEVFAASFTTNDDCDNASTARPNLALLGRLQLVRDVAQRRLGEINEELAELDVKTTKSRSSENKSTSRGTGAPISTFEVDD